MWLFRPVTTCPSTNVLTTSSFTVILAHIPPRPRRYLKAKAWREKEGISPDGLGPDDREKLEDLKDEAREGRMRWEAKK